MMLRILVALASAIAPIPASPWCGPVAFSGSAVMGPAPQPDGNGYIAPLCCIQTPYFFGGFSYNQPIPAGTTFYMTEMHLQTKGLESADYLPNGSYNFQTRRSYFVLNGIFTCTDHEETCRFNPPLAIPSGWLFATNSGLIDNSTNPGGGTHFTSMINGFARDQTCPYPQPVQGIPPGY